MNLKKNIKKCLLKNFRDIFNLKEVNVLNISLSESKGENFTNRIPWSPGGMGELGRIQEYKIGRGRRGRGKGVEYRIQET